MRFCPTCHRVWKEASQYCSNDGAALVAVSPQNDPLVGIELDGRYKLISLLGAGGTGFVYLAEQIGLKRTVAVKMLYAERTQDPANLRRLRREARALAALDHAGIVRVLDYGDGQGCTPYLVMEYARGRPLDLIVEQQGRLEPLHAVQIGSQLAGALNAAHRQGIIHRDLKPANVQLDTRAGNFQARILDFGFAFLATGLGQDNDSHSARLTRQGVIFGTPEYMAPEQIKGQSADGRTDLYALGVLLYELLAGAPPFRGAPPASVFMKHLEDTPPPLELPQIEAHTAQRLRQLVFGLLEKDPEARPQSAAAVQLELLGIETELPDSGSLVQVLPGNPGAGLQGHPTYPDPALHDGHSSEIPTQMVPGKDLMVAVPGPAPVPTEPVAQVDQQIEAALSGARRARRVTWALAGIAVVLLLFLGGRWLVALWRQPTPNTSVRSVLQRQPIAQRENVQVRTVSGEEAGDSLPGGVPQAAYEVKRRELDAALAARGLRVRDVWVLQQARQLWKLQERAASAQAFDIAMEHLDSFAALAERSPSAHILRRRLAQARRRSPAAGVTEQAALKALAATVTQAANSPGGTRTFLRRLATIERSIATRTAKTKGAP